VTGFGSRSTPERAGDPSDLERLLGSVSCVLSTCGWYDFPPGWAIEPRVLEDHVAYVVVDGVLTADLDGDRRQAGDGEILLAPPGVRHHVENRGPRSLVLQTVHFTARVHDVVDMPAAYGLPRQLRPSPAAMSGMREIVHGMIVELDARRPGCALIANADCARLLALLWREAVDQGGGDPSAGSARARDLVRLAPVFRLIRERYAERLTVAQLAEPVHLEPDYFAVVFKRVTGVPPLQYVAAHRLRQVRTLLATSDEPVRDIAGRTGYADSFYLARAFRRAYGMSPSAYRKSRNRPDFP
jgi:AraC-like DNA-binding protein